MLFDFEKFKRKYPGDINIPLAMAYKVSTVVHPSLKYRMCVSTLLCAIKETEAENYIHINDTDSLFADEVEEINFLINFYEVSDCLTFRQFKHSIRGNPVLRSIYNKYDEYKIGETYYPHMRYLKNIDISDVLFTDIKNISEYFEKLASIQSLEELAYNNIKQLANYYKNKNIDVRTIREYTREGDIFTTIEESSIGQEVGYFMHDMARILNLKFKFYEAKHVYLDYDGDDDINGDYIMELDCDPHTVVAIYDDIEYIPSILCGDLYFQSVDRSLGTKILSSKLYAANAEGVDSDFIIVY